ncbi:hypothetical protein TanjilG_26359 [Lupinus angustifolius]|uniref:HMA domain-containing protein n=1 Tax=Lupinus angustifolius TaxID=3871 RepID=A0A4P1R2X6_LUPAN|nr:PREDICTED: heavy metal-associated isoprenylated plant protein 35-like [Lupinus angustifolius]OIW00022.1 hypothetical protein TanjilG_26359 [Lupinus angustifolius]
MDAKYSEPLKYQIWSLKVSIHCEGCRRKVKKVLRSIDGVFTTTIDPQQQKVTVTGSVGVGVETLIRKLVKAGKHAEVWPENLTGKHKPAKKNEKRDQVANAESNLKKQEIKISNKCNGEKKNKDSKTGGNMPEKSPVSNQAPGQDRKSGQSEEGSGKKKKKKGQSVNGLSAPFNNAHAHTGSQFQMNISPTRQHSYPYADFYYYHPLLYFSTYNNLYPMGTMNVPSYYVPSYYVPSLPYKSSGLEYDPYYQVQSTPLVSFEIFSDENVNCCSIM